MFIAALFTIAKIWKQPKCPSTDKWIKKKSISTYTQTHTYTYTGILSHKKRNFEISEILPFTATWMDLEGIMLSEISQTKKDIYCMISLIYGI